MIDVLSNDYESRVNDISWYQTFEEVYINVRKKEQRIYTDDEIAMLPVINPANNHYKEWKARKSSSNRLVKYLRKKEKKLKILEIGCGNGWLCKYIAANVNCTVTGIDVNMAELIQAFRVHQRPNLDFIYGDPYEVLKGYSFDIIVFAASIQYFPSLKQILNHSFSLLNPGGEIHILDTFFYDEAEVENAAARTKYYYTHLGYPEMSRYYFHHIIPDLETFEYKVLYNGSVIHQLFKTSKPFPWIRITLT